MISSSSTSRNIVASTRTLRQQEWTAAIPTTVFTVLTVAFFAAHQAWTTGFFQKVWRLGTVSCKHINTAAHVCSGVL